MMIIHQFVYGLQHIGLQGIGLIFAILLMDAALSGDNSIAINALVLDLPEKMRAKAIWFGMILAAVFRVFALGLAAFIAANPWVQVLGAGYLFWLCYGHFKGEGEGKDRGKKQYASLVGVMVSIGFLDLSLSTDNIIAVVAMSQNIAIIVIGVLASIAMLAVAAQVVRMVMAKFPSLEGAAYVILAFLGAMMLSEHLAETVVWAGAKLGFSLEALKPFHYNLGEVGEIIGVASIVVGAVLKDKIQRHLQPKEVRVTTTIATK